MLGNNKVQVAAIRLDKDEVDVLILDATGNGQPHHEPFGLSWVEAGIRSGVNTLIQGGINFGI